MPRSTSEAPSSTQTLEAGMSTAPEDDPGITSWLSLFQVVAVGGNAPENSNWPGDWSPRNGKALSGAPTSGKFQSAANPDVDASIPSRALAEVVLSLLSMLRLFGWCIDASIPSSVLAESVLSLLFAPRLYGQCNMSCLRQTFFNPVREMPR